VIEFERIDDIEQANFLLNKCFNTIEELNNRIDEEKGRVQKYRETNTKLRSKHIELRDYFAAKAMHSVATLYPDWSDKAVCIAAYRMADAMIEARND
jgi:uncharacterized protein YdcH (DUF465 family)